ncbi:hypothetical protein ACFXPX_36830 [Kitasatospora sp. NPDC059146]|uniref:hypothetical protein n=1 Tax=unclassified Kitasatospora TaxID=2633591 RepID=UPI003691D33B
MTKRTAETKKPMKAATRTVKARLTRAVLRERAQEVRAQGGQAKAVAAVRTARPLPVAVIMTGAGYDPADAYRNAGAISKKLGKADAMSKTRKRLTTKSPTRVNKGGKNRRMKTMPVKLFAPARVLALLETHRPKNPEVAARFEAVALSPRFRALALSLAA